MPDTDKNGKKIRYVAHRGGMFYRPQNSMAAFEYTLTHGIDWIECDVRLSSDGIPVLFHDERVQAPGRGNCEIRETTAEELRTVDIGGGQTLPAVSDLLDKFGNKLNYDFDIKVLDGVDKVIELVREYGIQENCMISSFYAEALQRSREIAPEITRGYLIDRLTGRLVNGKAAVRAAKLLKCKYFLPHFKLLSQDWAEAALAGGLRIIPWTVNRVEDAQRLIDCGVSGLISDRPDYLKALM
ncbi:glycerophosphodiester phosphodiesterase [bacterium]|nr:glycerophosphodiester phosphodiesterase [bacterium]